MLNGKVLVTGGYIAIVVYLLRRNLRPGGGDLDGRRLLTPARRLSHGHPLAQWPVLVAGGWNSSGYLAGVEAYDPLGEPGAAAPCPRASLITRLPFT